MLISEQSEFIPKCLFLSSDQDSLKQCSMVTLSTAVRSVRHETLQLKCLQHTMCFLTCKHEGFATDLAQCELLVTVMVFGFGSAAACPRLQTVQNFVVSVLEAQKLLQVAVDTFLSAGVPHGKKLF